MEKTETCSKKMRRAHAGAKVSKLTDKKASGGARFIRALCRNKGSLMSSTRMTRAKERLVPLQALEASDLRQKIRFCRRLRFRRTLENISDRSNTCLGADNGAADAPAGLPPSTFGTFPPPSIRY